MPQSEQEDMAKSLWVLYRCAKFVFISNPHLPVLLLFPFAALTNYYKLSGLKSYRFILHFYKVCWVSLVLEADSLSGGFESNSFPFVFHLLEATLPALPHGTSLRLPSQQHEFYSAMSDPSYFCSTFNDPCEHSGSIVQTVQGNPTSYDPLIGNLNSICDLNFPFLCNLAYLHVPVMEIYNFEGHYLHY